MEPTRWSVLPQVIGHLPIPSLQQLGNALLLCVLCVSLLPRVPAGMVYKRDIWAAILFISGLSGAAINQEVLTKSTQFRFKDYQLVAQREIGKT